MANVQLFAKLDANLFLNPKVCELGERNPRAAWAWVKAITYSVSQRTDGYVGDYVWRTFLSATDDELADLEQARMIEPADGGYMIHDYLDVQMSVEEQEARRARKAKAGKLGGKAKASKTGKATGDTTSDTTTQAPAKQVSSKCLANAKQTPSTCLQGATTTSKQTLADIDIDKDIDIYPPYSPPTGDGDDGFAEAWSAYPKHAGSKQAAHDAYTATLATTGRDRLHRAITAYAGKTRRDKDDPHWIPTMENWLTREQWREWEHTADVPARYTPPEHRHTATCSHVLEHMNPLRDQYPARAVGIGPSDEFAAACQKYANQLNQQQQAPAKDAP